MSASARLPMALLLVAACMGLLACDPKPAGAPAAKPAATAAVGHETELLKVTLTPEAETRLGLKTTVVGRGSAQPVRTVHGEVVVPPMRGGIPTTSTTDLAALGANQAIADGDVGRTRAELQVAQRAYDRAAALVKEEAGSVRARDEAEAVLGAARANLAAAQARRALQGPAIAGMGRGGPVWIRVAAFAADLDSIDRTGSALVRTLGGSPVVRSARPVAGPPTANLAAGTVDLFYALPNVGGGLQVGQRVAVDLPVRGRSDGLFVPVSALIRDIYGGEWVYVRSAPHAYERRRVELASQKDGQALVARGLSPGDEVVAAGAMEIYGAEFGSK